MDEEIANALAEAMAEEVGDSIAETVDETIVEADGEPSTGESSDASGDVAEDEAARNDVGTTPDDDRDEAEWVFVDGETDDEWVSATRTGTDHAEVEEVDTSSDPDEADPDSDADEAGPDSDGRDAEPGVADAETRIERSGSVSTEPSGTGPSGTGQSVTDITSLDADEFRSLVAALFEASGWETESRGESLGTADLRATTPGPVAVTAAVLTVDAATAAAVDPDDIDRIAEAVERDGDLDEPVVAAGGSLPEATRQRASDQGVRVVDPDDIEGLADETGISLPVDESAAS